MGFTAATLLLSLSLFAGMLVLLELGSRIGTRQRAKDPDGWHAGVGTVDAAVFGLLGLLLAFSFSGTASRFDERRALIVEETNFIGTAWLRLDVLPASAQPALKELFRRYVDSRLEVYRKIPDMDSARAELQRSAELQREIWRQAIRAATMEGAHPSAPILVLPSLNQMIDITTTRTMAAELHPPTIILVLLFGISLVSALLAGYGMAEGTSRRRMHRLGFAAVSALALYVIIDIEYPRMGLIRVDPFDHALRDLRATMK